MDKNNRQELSIEFEEVTVVRRAAIPVPLWCGECSARVPMFLADQAALEARINTRTIYRLVEARRVHFIETRDGSLLVCAKSLGAVVGHKLKDHNDRPDPIEEPAGLTPAIDISPTTEGELL